MTQISTKPKQYVDFSGLSNRTAFNATLCSTYIAQATFVAVDIIQVSVLDCSQIADTLRTQPTVAFEVNLSDTMRLCGTAIVSLGASYVGANNKRIIDVVLRLEEAYEEHFVSAVLQWLT